MEFTIRDVSSADLGAVLDLNEQVVPAVNSLTPDKMRWFEANAPYFRVAVRNQRLGAFLIGLRPGIDYESRNYRWFCEHYDDFGYIDRIAVAADTRRAGLASLMYEDFGEFLSGAVPRMACEVNTRPPNPVSMRFHENFGFRQVSSMHHDDGAKEVALLIRQL
jgi:predicted GNAT superfamily acetyltransferase